MPSLRQILGGMTTAPIYICGDLRQAARILGRKYRWILRTVSSDRRTSAGGQTDARLQQKMNGISAPRDLCASFSSSAACMRFHLQDDRHGSGACRKMLLSTSNSVRCALGSRHQTSGSTFLSLIQEAVGLVAPQSFGCEKLATFRRQRTHANTT